MTFDKTPEQNNTLPPSSHSFSRPAVNVSHQAADEMMERSEALTSHLFSVMGLMLKSLTRPRS